MVLLVPLARHDTFPAADRAIINRDAVYEARGAAYRRHVWIRWGVIRRRRISVEGFV